MPLTGNVPLFVILTVNVTSSPGAAWSGLAEKTNESKGAGPVGVKVTVGLAGGVTLDVGVAVSVKDGVKVGSKVAVGLTDSVALGVGVTVSVNDGVKDGSKVAVRLADGVAFGVSVAVSVNDGVKDGSKVAVVLADGVALNVGVSVLVNRGGVIVGVSCSDASNHARSLSMNDKPALLEFVVSTGSDVNGVAATGEAPIALNRNTKIRQTLTIVFIPCLNLNMMPSLRS